MTGPELGTDTQSIPQKKWRRYPRYKDSGVEWLGEVPVEWEIKRIKFASPRVNTKIEGQTDLPYIGLENIESWTGKSISSPESLEIEGQSTQFQVGDVLFNKLRPYLAKVYMATGTGRCTSELLVLRPKLLKQHYLFYFLISRDFVLTVDSSTYGAKMPRANWDYIGNLPSTIPSIQEQYAITSFLDHETARIDTLIVKKERQVELLQEKRSAIISHAITKGLDPSAPMRDSGIDWIGKIPEHWEIVRIKWIAEMESGHTPDKKVEEYWINCNIPWVSLNDTPHMKLHDYISDTAFCVNELGLANSSAHLLPERAVVFTRDATIGLCAITTRPMAVSQHIIAWICGPRIYPEYLLRVFYAMNQELERLTMGSTIKTIGMSDVLELITPKPPLEEQMEIVRSIEKEASCIDRLLLKINESIELLREYRTALISAAVTGKIDVRQEMVT